MMSIFPPCSIVNCLISVPGMCEEIDLSPSSEWLCKNNFLIYKNLLCDQHYMVDSVTETLK